MPIIRPNQLTEIHDSDVYHKVKHGERLDYLAEIYYNDASLWWVIAKANSLLFCYDLVTDQQLRIPLDILVFST